MRSRGLCAEMSLGFLGTLSPVRHSCFLIFCRHLELSAATTITSDFTDPGTDISNSTSESHFPYSRDWHVYHSVLLSCYVISHRLSHTFYTHLTTRELSFLFLLLESTYSFRTTLSLPLPHCSSVRQTTLPHPGETPRPCGEMGKRIMKKSRWSLPPHPRKAQREMNRKKRRGSRARVGWAWMGLGNILGVNCQGQLVLHVGWG